MNDISKSVIMPREDFLELQAVAWDSLPLSAMQRIGEVTQKLAFVSGCAVAVTAAAWGCVRAMNWYDEKSFQRRLRERQLQGAAKK